MSYAAHHKNFGSLVANEVPQKIAAVRRSPSIAKTLREKLIYHAQG